MHPRLFVETAFAGERPRLLDDLGNHRRRGDAQATTADVERFQRVDLAAAFDADDVLAWHAHAGQAQFVGRRAALAHFLFVLANNQSLGVTVDEEPSGAFGRAGIQAHHASDVAVGDPHLRAIEFVVLIKLPTVFAANLRNVVNPHAAVRAVAGAGGMIVTAVINLRHVQSGRVEDVFPVVADHEIFHAVGIGEHLGAFQIAARLHATGITSRIWLRQRKRTDLA